MKKIVLVLSLVMALSGCCLDELEQEEAYMESHVVPSVLVGNGASSSSPSYYYYIDANGDIINVTLDEDGNVYNMDGVYLFSVQD